MKITIDLENLQDQVESAAKINVEEAIKTAIDTIVKTHIEANYSDVIDRVVNETMESAVREKLDTIQITVGNSFVDDEVKTYTPRQYILHQINEIFENKSFRIPVKDSYYGRETVKTITFEEWLKKEFKFDEYIKNELSKFGTDTKQQLNKHMKETYNTELQRTLCSTVVDVIMQDEAFKHINEGIKRLGE